MGEAEINRHSRTLTVHATFFIYGDAANRELAELIAREIGMMWNEPDARIKIRNEWYTLRFAIDGVHEPGLQAETVWYNDNPRYNFFRVEEYAHGNISFVDGIGSNTGYFKLDNLLNQSTTAAHEFGHTLGLVHPENIDIRGRGIPGIMYPRGTICDPEFQYDPAAVPLGPGGTMNPRYRKVLQSDVEEMGLGRLHFTENGFATIGDFSSLFHEKETPD